MNTDLKTARGDCERPWFDQLKAHILKRLLFCWRSKMCLCAAGKNMSAYNHFLPLRWFSNCSTKSADISQNMDFLITRTIRHFEKNKNVFFMDPSFIVDTYVLSKVNVKYDHATSLKRNGFICCQLTSKWKTQKKLLATFFGSYQEWYQWWEKYFNLIISALSDKKKIFREICQIKPCRLREVA